jgi:hypothetical protein
VRAQGVDDVPASSSVSSERLAITRRFLLPLLTVALTMTALLTASAPAGAAQLDLVGANSFGSLSLYPYQPWANESYAPT